MCRTSIKYNYNDFNYNNEIDKSSYIGYEQKQCDPCSTTKSLKTTNNDYIDSHAYDFTYGLEFQDHGAKEILVKDKHNDLPILDIYNDKSLYQDINDSELYVPVIDGVTVTDKVFKKQEPQEEHNKPYISPLVGNVPGYFVPNHRVDEKFKVSYNSKKHIPQIEMTTKEFDNITKLFDPNTNTLSVHLQGKNSTGDINITENNKYDTKGEINLNQKISMSYNTVNKCKLGDINCTNERFTNSLGIENNENNLETFISNRQYDVTQKQAIINYLEALRSRATAVCFYLKSNPSYKEWTKNWNFLEENLQKTRLLFERLDESDADIAYVINKGEEMKFRIHDEKRFIPLNIYQYVLYHEMAHLSTHELQHTPTFHKLLNIISLAGFELGFVDLNRVQKTFYKTNGVPIICRSIFKEEIIAGCRWLMKSNPKSKEYYEDMIKLVSDK